MSREGGMLRWFSHHAFLFTLFTFKWILLWIVFCGPGLAHQAGESYLFLQAQKDKLTGRMEIIIDDLGLALPLDDNGDGTVSKAEFDQNEAKIYEFLEPHLTFHLGERAIPMAITGHEFVEVTFGTYAHIHFRVLDNEQVPEEMDVQHFGFMEKVKPSHKVYLVIEDNERTGLLKNEGTVSHIFEGAEGRTTVSFLGDTAGIVFLRFVNFGINHIVVGFDHLALLFALMLTAVLSTRKGKWEPVDQFHTATLYLLAAVTLFAIANSITLSMSALGFVKFPSNFVDALVAIFILILALCNVFGPLRIPVLSAVFLIGLVHGLGYSTILAPYGVAETALFTTLSGYNIGVEFGYIALILVCLPILYALRTWEHYVLVVVRGGSLLLILIVAYWLSERGIRAADNLLVWLGVL